MGLLGSLFGGGSNTVGGIGTSESRNTSNQHDARVVGGNGSTNTSTLIAGGTNTLTLTDHGSVAAGIGAALSGVEAVRTITAQAQAAQGNLLDGALRLSSDQALQFGNTLRDIKTGDLRSMVIFGWVAAAAIAAYAVTHYKR